MHHRPHLRSLAPRSSIRSALGLASSMLVPLAFACAGRPTGGPDAEPPRLDAAQAGGKCTDPCCGISTCTDLGDQEPRSNASAFTLEDNAPHLTIDDTTIDAGKYVFSPTASSTEGTFEVHVLPDNNDLVQETFSGASTPWGWCWQDQNGDGGSEAHTSTSQETTMSLTIPVAGKDANEYAVRLWGCAGSTFVTDDPKVVVRPKQASGYANMPSTPPAPLETCRGEPTTEDAQTCACLRACGDISGHGGKKGCGWCTTEQIAMEGDSSGPTNGSCENWIWSSSTCDCATITECSGIEGDGGDQGCGWCTLLDQAMVGSKSGPEVGSCGTNNEQWIWNHDDC